jgi:tetratricopeptide (TPR) repeat protein
MKKSILSILLILPIILIWGQEERKYIREGYKAYMDEDYNKAEIGFRKAEDANYDSYIARYNTSTALYQQQKTEESGKAIGELLKETNDPVEQSKLLHNLGNVMMDSQQFGQAVEAYKGSLRLNPMDEDTRYNLAYALEKLKEQQQQQQENKNQDNKDQQDDQENKESDQDEQGEKQEQDQQSNKEDQEDKQDQQKAEQKKQEMNQEEAERLLNAILQIEKDVKEKVDKKKATAAKVKTDKDW